MLTGEFSSITCYRRIWRTSARTNTKETTAQLASRSPRAVITRDVWFLQMIRRTAPLLFRRTPRSTETTSSVACFLIANARLILSATHSKISALKISNRERMAFSEHHSPARFTPAPTRHSSLITHHFISNRNIRFTEFQLTPLTTVLTQFLTATNTCFCRTPRPPRRPLMLPVPHHSPACTDFHFTV